MDCVTTLQSNVTTLQTSTTMLQTQVTQLETDKLNVTGGTITGSLLVRGSRTESGSLSVTGTLTVGTHNVMTEIGTLQGNVTALQDTTMNLRDDVSTLKKDVTQLGTDKLNVTGGTISGSLSVRGSLTVDGRNVLTELSNLASSNLGLSGGTISGPLTITGKVTTNTAYAFGGFSWSGNTECAYLTSPAGGSTVSVSKAGRMHIGDIVGDYDVPLEIAGQLRLRSSAMSENDAGLLFAHNAFSGTSSDPSSARTAIKTDLARMGMYYDEMQGESLLAIKGMKKVSGAAVWEQVMALGVESGDMWILGSPTYGHSDARLKKNVEQLQGALDKLLQLRGVTFEWQEPTKHRGATGSQIGLIAQEVEVFFPQWIGETPDGYKTLKIGTFEALVIEALRELQNQLRAERGQPAMPQPQPPSAREMHAADAARKHGRRKRTVVGNEIVATYDYQDEQGKLLYQVQRYLPKAFRMRRPDGTGGWIGDTVGIRPVLFHLPEVMAADNVLIVEGEKDAQTAIALGLPDSTWAVTTSPGPVEWRSSYSMSLRGKRVVICPDADRAGMRHMHHIVRDLGGIVADVRWIELPSGPKDITEWVEAGGTKEQLAVLIGDAKAVCADDLPPLPPMRQRKRETLPGTSPSERGG